MGLNLLLQLLTLYHCLRVDSSATSPLFGGDTRASSDRRFASIGQGSFLLVALEFERCDLLLERRDRCLLGLQQPRQGTGLFLRLLALVVAGPQFLLPFPPLPLQRVEEAGEPRGLVLFRRLAVFDFYEDVGLSLSEGPG